MEGYGRAGGRRGRSRDGRQRGGFGGETGGRQGRGGRADGGRGRENYQYQQHHQQEQHVRQPSPGNQWASGPGEGRGGLIWRPAASLPGNPRPPVPIWLPAPSSPVISAGQQPVSSVSYAAKLQSSSLSRPSGAIAPKKQSLNISWQTSQSSIGERIQPIKRPDNGGVVSINTVNILVNHFPVSFNPEAVIRHYDICVTPEGAPAEGRSWKISKANLSMVLDKLFSDEPSFPLEMAAYDGEKNIFSAVSLPTGEFKVNLPGGEATRCYPYSISVNLVNELSLHKLKDYLEGNLLQIPRDVLQAMDVVMKENPRRCMIGIGRSFHPKDPNRKFENGLALSLGFQHGLKPTLQGLALCLDYSALAVRKQMPVLDFLDEHICGFTRNRINNKMKMRIEEALKGLKVTVTHRVTKQKYVVSGLTDEPASDISFTLEDPAAQGPSTSVRLVDYFKKKYGREIQYRDIPCLNLGRGGRVNYVPMELCVLVEGQRYPKENLDNDSARCLKEMSLAKPEDRKSMICLMLQDKKCGPSGGEICNNFEMDVRMNMTEVQGRVMRPPILKLRSLRGQECEVHPRNEMRDWNLRYRSVVEGISLERWAVIDFRTNPREDVNTFINDLVVRCRTLGLGMTEPVKVERGQMLALKNVGLLTELMERINFDVSGCRNLQLILCVMGQKDDGYKYIKWISETKVGVVTQCCIIRWKANDQYLANLGMKINAKLGGSNVELNNRLPLFEDDSHVMLIGADVNHPRPMDRSSPSIAAVVASMNWPAANKYSPRVRFQQHGSERIINFGEICLELIYAYEKSNGVKPGKILIFRDGVSEGQFEMVLNEELHDLKNVLEEIKHHPTITLIVAQKRHHTRLFPETPSGMAGNVPPGTVVDQTIVHPFEFDFYLCSHHGNMGTSKPTHYHVLWDEHGFSSDNLQQLIYNLCFTFARCCKPVSLVPPIYYADLLAYRGRLYLDVLSQKHSSGSSSSSMGTSFSSTSGGASIDESICKLHTDLENMMFFI